MTTIAQIIVILFKDQSVEKIQNRLSALMSSSTSESSDGDDESNISFDKVIFKKNAPSHYSTFIDDERYNGHYVDQHLRKW